MLDTSPNGNVKIVIDQATKYYDTKTGKLHALEKFSAAISQGELVCILGPSGCGKTTLLWAMSGLHALTSGAVLLDNKPVTGPRPEIGMVFQDANLLPWRNLIQNILFPFEIKRLNPDTYHDRIQLTAADAVTNKFIADANNFDKDEVAADAKSYPVSDAWKNLKLQGPI